MIWDTISYNQPELLWERLFIPGNADPKVPFCGDAVADWVCPLSRIPLAAAAAVATLAILSCPPASLVFPADAEVGCIGKTEEDPKSKWDGFVILGYSSRYINIIFRKNAFRSE